MAKEIAIKIKVDGKDISQVDKDLASLGDTIGDLKKELKAMGERTEENADLFDELSGDLDELEKSFEGATKEAKVYNKELDKTAKGVEDVGKGASKTKKGFGTMKLGIKGIGTALKAAGIGIVLALFAALFSLLKSNQKVIDFFNVAAKTMEILFKKLLDALTPLKDALMAAFDDPKQAVIDLWNVIKTNIMNRIMGLVDTFKFLGKTIQAAFNLDWDGLKENAAAVGESMIQTFTGVDNLIGKVTDAFGNLVDEVEEATTAAKDYTKAVNALKLAEAEQNKISAANLLQLETLKTLREDETKSVEERIAAADRIAELIKEETDGQIALQEEKIRLMNLDLKLTDTLIEDQVAIANAEAELDRIRAAATVTNLENLKFANTLRKQEADRIQAEKDVAQAKVDEEAKAELDRLTAYRDRRKELEQQWALDDADSAQEFYDELRLQEEERFILEMENTALTNEEREFAEKEHKRKMKEINDNYLEEKDDAEKASGIQILDWTEATEDQKLAIIKRNLANAQSLFEEHTAAYRILASAQALIDTYASAVASYGSLAGIPIVGPALGAIAAAISVAAGLANVAKINKVKFEDGGDIYGASHLQGGVNINAQGGESVMNRESTAMFAPMLSAMNQAGGGRPITGSATSYGGDNPVVSNPALESTPIIKTYVVSNEMTSEIEKNARLKELSTI